MKLVISLMIIALSMNAQITTKSLLKEMTDLKALAEFPIKAYTTKQFSSYDRHSISPDHPGWFGNEDGFGHERIPGFEKVLSEPDEDGIGRYLICDVDGPGAMVRIWTAWFTGELEVYLNGNDEALYKGPAQDFVFNTYDAISGSKGIYNKEGVFFQNTAGYYPIPFSHGFKMIWTGKIQDLHFYHIQLRLYEDKTRIYTFSTDDLIASQNEINMLLQKLNDPIENFSGKGAQSSVSKIIQAGEESTIFVSKGEEAITQFELKIEAKDLSVALRQSILKIRFDGASSAQVQSPVGDFFGAAPGINPYHSLPFSVLPDGRMICRFYMPYRDSIEISIQNLGEDEVKILADITTENYFWKENSMYFRARWRIDHGLFASYDPSQDIPYLFANGKGVMVGASAYIYNPTSVPSSYGNWWGEGDEKIFIDHAEFPDFFGTGSEDYFNYAWSSSAIFTHPYCGQPRNDGPANRGFVTNYRWHILDKIPFNTGFTFYMELMSHEPVENFSYGRTVYLYGKPGMYDDHMLITKEDVRQLKLPKNWQPIGRKGSHNATFIQAEDLLIDKTNVEFESDPLWSGDKILCWEPDSSKDELKLKIDIENEGEYVLVFTIGKDKEGGQYIFSHNGIPIELRGNTIVDFKDSYRVISRNYRSPKLKMHQGVNDITITASGSNNGKMKLDFVWLMAQ